VDNDYLSSGQIKLSYQNGMDGQRRSFTLPRWILLVLMLLGLFLLISTIVLYVMIFSLSARNARLERLEVENNGLRNKVDFYAATVDSIYNKLDSMQANKGQETKDFPSLGFGQNPKLTDFAYDPILRGKINILETKLGYILQQVSPEETYVTPTLDELPTGELPPDYMPSIYPTFGRISDGWGLRVHPITQNIEFHYGIDIANQSGTPVYATASGTVITTDFDTGYGKRIVINHGNGYTTLYAHLYGYMVRVGDRVGKGQIIGQIGNSGISTGPHLHYEVQNADGKVNPTAYLNRIDEPQYAIR